VDAAQVGIAVNVAHDGSWELVGAGVALIFFILLDMLLFRLFLTTKLSFLMDLEDILDFLSFLVSYFFDLDMLERDGELPNFFMLRCVCLDFIILIGRGARVGCFGGIVVRARVGDDVWATSIVGACVVRSMIGVAVGSAVTGNRGDVGFAVG